MSALKNGVRQVVPLRARMGLASWLGRNRWVPGADRWAQGLVRDLEAVDPKRYHKLLWENHFEEYGRAYDAAHLFSAGKLNGTVAAYRAFVDDLDAASEKLGVQGQLDRILDVGCSVGHVLRALETGVLTDARTLVGIDIDRVAIDAGRSYLAEAGSRIQLACGDLEDLDALIGATRFDFSYAAGSLSYLDEADARRAMHAVLARTERLAAFIGLANPHGPNGSLERSAFRADLGSMWTHDFGSMVEECGWQVVSSRWQPPAGDDDQGLYSVFAAPCGRAP